MKPSDLKAADVQPNTEQTASLPETSEAEAVDPEAVEPAPEDTQEAVEPATVPAEWTFETWKARVEKTAQMNKKTIPDGTDLQALFDAGDNPWQAYLRVAK